MFCSIQKFSISIGSIGFWNITLKEYVFLQADAAEYIGHLFNKQTYDGNGNMVWTAVELVSAAVYN